MSFSERLREARSRWIRLVVEEVSTISSAGAEAGFDDRKKVRQNLRRAIKLEAELLFLYLRSDGKNHPEFVQGFPVLAYVDLIRATNIPEATEEAILQAKIRDLRRRAVALETFDLLHRTRAGNRVQIEKLQSIVPTPTTSHLSPNTTLWRTSLRTRSDVEKSLDEVAETLAFALARWQTACDERALPEDSLKHWNLSDTDTAEVFMYFQIAGLSRDKPTVLQKEAVHKAESELSPLMDLEEQLFGVNNSTKKRRDRLRKSIVKGRDALEEADLINVNVGANQARITLTEAGKAFYDTLEGGNPPERIDP